MKVAGKIALLFVFFALVATAMTGARRKPDTVATVTFYLGTECPVSAAYTSRIAALAKEYSSKGVSFVALFPQASDDAGKLKDYAMERGFDFECRLDPGAVQALADGVKTIPTAVVKDANGKHFYFGAIDDNKNTELVKTEYLVTALEAALNGNGQYIPKTEPIGCVLTPGAVAPPMKPVTYADDVAKIFNSHCVTCHRPGEVAPFSLIGYDNAKNWAPTIALVTASRKMPPWKAVAGIGDFQHENRLSDLEIATIKAWAEAGSPRGDSKKEPPTPTFASDWALGEPDITLQIPKPFKVSADGQDEYWHFVLKPDIKEPVFIQAIDVKPGNKKIVHHVILWLDDRGQADKILAKKGKDGAYLTFGSPGFLPDNSLGGWAPGLMPTRSPEDAGILLKPGTNVVLEVHYHKDGKPETDQTKVALYFAKDSKKITNPIRIAWIANLGIHIKAGVAGQRFSQTIPIPVDVKLYALMPHMHMLGREMKATLIKPDGSEEPLIAIDDWDFNWQFSYALKQPKILKAGSKLRVDAVYDNSTGNPNNPNSPPADVTWGEQTTDEMMLLVAAISVPNGGRGIGDFGASSNRGAVVKGLLNRILANRKKQ